MTVIDRLKALPHQHPDFSVWLENEDHYSFYYKIFQALNPDSVLELGTCLGFSLAAAAMALPAKDLHLSWVDDESYLPGSNELAWENIWGVFKGRFEGESPFHPLRYWTSPPPAGRVRGLYQLVHVDGDHSYDGCLKDLEYAEAVRPQIILGHDYHLEEGVRRAVSGFCAKHSYAHFVLDRFKHGLFCVDRTARAPDTLWRLAAADVGGVRVVVPGAVGA
jgi:hypothetical protein